MDIRFRYGRLSDSEHQISIDPSLLTFNQHLPLPPMQQPAQQSVTSLARYTPSRANGVDLFHGHESRDYCNAFWGPGDTGPNVLLARMRGAEKTMDELRSFWLERSVSSICLPRSLVRC